MFKYKKIFISLFLLALFLNFNLKNIIAQVSNEENLSAVEINNNALLQKKAELEQKIKEKNEALQKINEQLQNTKSNLEDVKKQKNSLQKEINQLNQVIKQLELNISADETTIQKLQLEIESLNYDIQNINFSINKKQEAIIKVLQEIQKSGDKNLLTILLGNNSLADSFAEAQNLSNLRSQLQIDIANLNNLNKELNNKLELTKNKQTDIQNHKISLTQKQFIINDQKQTKNIILSQTKNQESLYQKQLDELQKQQNALEEEIYQMEEELRKTFNLSILPSKKSGILEWPIKLKTDGGIGIITQRYGQTPYSSRLYRGKPHNGLDIGVPIGTPVYAADDGIVMAVDNNDRNFWAKYQYGKYVLIKHQNNLATLYAHLSTWIVSKGQEVKRGQLIGYSGNTGYSTGPHLHFGVYWQPSIILKSISPAAGLVPVGVTVNPEDYL
ncbi:MAG: murein hydrolase activator EnvC family protein [Minisyncoccia bacterium]